VKRHTALGPTDCTSTALGDKVNSRPGERKERGGCVYSGTRAASTAWAMTGHVHRGDPSLQACGLGGSAAFYVDGAAQAFFHV